MDTTQAEAGGHTPFGTRHFRRVRSADRSEPALRCGAQPRAHKKERQGSAVPLPEASEPSPHALPLAGSLFPSHFPGGAARRACRRFALVQPQQCPSPVREGPCDLRLPDPAGERGDRPHHPRSLPRAGSGRPVPPVPDAPGPPGGLYRGDHPLRAKHGLRVLPLPALRTPFPRTGFSPRPTECRPLRGEVLLGERGVRLLGPGAIPKDARSALGTRAEALSSRGGGGGAAAYRT